MKIIKLNRKGMTHYLIPLVVIIIVAIGGTLAYLESHADQLTATSCQAPSSPEGNDVSGDGDHSIVIGWVASKTSTKCPLSGYAIYRAVGDSTNFKYLNSVPSSQTLYTDNGLKPLTEYSYYVVAQDKAGKVSADSNTDSLNTASAASTNCTNRLFEYSTKTPTKSICVLYAKIMLNGFNSYFKVYNNPTVNNNSSPPVQLTVSGSDATLFDLNTNKQVMRWQYISNIFVDGDLGPQTWTRLCYWDARMWNNFVNKYPFNATIPAYITDAENQAAPASC